MPSILQVSDLHFGSPFLPDRAEGVLRLEAELGPDLTVIAGDFTQRAKRRQFVAARAYMSRFVTPLVVTSGNHDVPLFRFWERVISPHGKYRRFIHGERDYVHRQAGLTVVSLDSARSLTFTNGRLRPAQLELAERAFEGSPAGDLRVVVVHHPLTPAPVSDQAVVVGWKRALQVFTAQGVHLVLAGHKHRAYVGHSLDWVRATPETRDVLIVHSGTATSSRGRGLERGRNSLNFIRADEHGMRITLYMWEEAAAAFRAHSERRFAPPGKQWIGEHPVSRS